MTEMWLGRAGAASLLSATIVGVLLPMAAYAYTPEQEQACTSDAFRLCSSEIPDIDRVTACMVRNKAQLSPPCRAQFGPDPAAETASVAAGRPLSIRPAKIRKQVSTRSHRAKASGKPHTT